MVLVDGHLSAGERDETEEERDDAPVAVEGETDIANPEDGGDIEPDMDDVAGTAELTESKTAQAPEAWISIDDTNPPEESPQSEYPPNVFKPSYHCRLEGSVKMYPWLLPVQRVEIWS